MPISEDELEHYQQQMHTGGMSKAEQRRSNKPIMEKRRRARINHCLNELKCLILDAMKKDPARHSKLEKADILEMTVKHLQSIQRQQLTMAVGADPGVVHKFQTGFSECAGEVSRYIGRMDGVEPGVKQRLVSHLASCVSGLQEISPFQTQSQTQSSSPEDVNNNTASARLQMLSGLQLIPSRLPSGELALLLPNSQNLPFFPAPLDNQVSTTSEPASGGLVDRGRTSAFTAVSRERFSKSPLASPTSTTASSYGEDSCDQPYPSPGHPQEVTSTSEHPPNPPNYPLQTLRPAEPQGIHAPTSNLTDLKSQPQSFHRFIPPAGKPIHTPLTVITSDEMLREVPQRRLDVHAPEPNIKNPLDFSIKKDNTPLHDPYPQHSIKRPFHEDGSDKFLLKTAEFQPPAKISKTFHWPQNNYRVPERRNLHEIQNQVPNYPSETSSRYPDRRSLFDLQNQPSTSSAETSRDMWRPW